MKQEEEKKVDSSKLQEIITRLDELGYDYIEGFVTNKKDKVRAIHRKCGRERYAKFSLYDKQECRFCKRIKTPGKYFNTITPEHEAVIFKLHSNGKNNIEIAKQIGVTNAAIGMFLKKHDLKVNRKPSKLIEAKCIICGVTFMPKYHNRNKVCSKECSIEHTRQCKIKYNKKQIDAVINFKKTNATNKDIEQITGVNVNKIKEIVKENQLFVGPEIAQKNAYDKKLEKNANAMMDMRNAHMKYNTEEYEKRFNEIVATLELPDNKYGIPYLCTKYDVNPNSIRNTMNCRGLGHLITPMASAAEFELVDFIKEHLPNLIIEQNDRNILKGKEIDILMPELKLGIEYCGLYWHNELKKPDTHYHYNKMKQAEEQGIRLITIFEDEWRDRNKQVKNFLKSVLNIHNKRVYARKCQVKTITKKVAKLFLEDNHIQGAGHIEVAFGLFGLEDELLGVLSACKHHRISTNPSLVLNRLAFQGGCQVVGGASKLLKSLIKYANQEKKYDSILSWSDNRWSIGTVYEKTGFKSDDELPPDYSYVDMETRFSKQSCKKNVLLSKGAVGNTEKELATNLELYRIWDCGKKRWVINLSK